MSDGEDGGGGAGSKRFNRLSGSDTSSREGSPRSKRPKRSFTPNSDDGDLVVTPVGEHIDDTPPPEGQPILRQPVAFNWDKATAPIQTYSAPAKPAVNYFLPGQAPVAGPSRTPAGPAPPAATSSQRLPSPSPSWQPPPPPNRRKPTSSSRKKKSETKTRHFNDEFSYQTGRFKVGPGFVNDPQAVEPPPIVHGTGPYSSMYRMGVDPPGAPMTAAISASVSPVPPQPSKPHQPANTYHPTASSSMTTPASQPKASGIKTPSSSKHRSSAKQSTTQRHPEQTNQASTVKPQYYRRDYDRDDNMQGSSRETPGASGTSRARPKESSIPRTDSQPRDAPSPSLSSITLQNNSGDNYASSPGQDAGVEHRPQGPVRQLRMVTILIEDIRSGVVDHQLAEVRVHLYDRSERFWADAQEVCEQLQSSPSRIDGPARVYTLRGKYRQFFLRVTPDNVDEITSSNLQIARERTLDIVVEPLPQQGVLPQPPMIPREVLSPSPESELMASHPFLGLPNEKALEHFHRMVPQKRRRSISPLGSPHQRQFAHISPHASPPPPQSSSLLPLRKVTKPTQNSSYDYSLMSPRTAQYYQNYARSYNIPLPTSPNTPGRMGTSQEEIDTAIVRFIKPLVEEDPLWMKYMESKAKPPRVAEVLKQYQFIQGKVDELCGTSTPIHWDGAPDLEVRKEHVWKILNLESPGGLDCQETLSLLRLYGLDGQRYEDSRVVDMINDTSNPTGKPYKRFLKLLRQVDLDWLKDNPDDAESDGSSGSPREGTTSRKGKGKGKDVSVHGFAG